MSKKTLTLFTIVISLFLFSGCDYILEDMGLVSSNDREVSEPEKKATKKQKGGRKKVSYNIPENLPKKHGFFIQVNDAVGNPVDNAKILIVFHGKNQYGDELTWGQKIENYSYIFHTGHDGNKKIKLPAWQCYLWDAYIEVSKKGYHKAEKNHIKFDVDKEEIIVMNMWRKKQWDAAKKTSEG